MANPPKPTDAELSILRVLWQAGPSTVRAVHEQMDGDRKVGYTTILKLLQIMADKGLVQRDESERSHVYRASSSQEKTQNQLVADLLDKAFGGSARQLVMRALSARKADAKELNEIRSLIDEMERGSK